jgi:hypothetical protein
MIPTDLIEDINERLLPFGGYSELSKYLSEADLIDIALFGGETIFLSSFLTAEGFPEPTVDLQDYSYTPGQLLTVLDQNLKVLTQKVLTPLNINGAKTYCWGSTTAERSLLFTKHAGRYFFSFETYNGTKLVQVLVQTKIQPEKQQQLLQEWTTLQQYNSQQEVFTQLDELFIEFLPQYAPLSLFIAESVPSSSHLFSPQYQQVYKAGENIYISSANKNLLMSFRYLTVTEELSLLNLSEEDLVSDLNSLNYSKIYEDPVDGLQYWISVDNDYRLDITLSNGVVTLAVKNTLNVLTLDMVGEGQSRLKFKNGIYSLKAAGRPDLLQPSRTVRLNIRAKATD